MGSVVLNQIRDNVTKLEPRIARDNILISITHSHSSPDFQGLWMGVYATYRDRVVLAAAHTIVDAFNKRVPARLFCLSGSGIQQQSQRLGLGSKRDDHCGRSGQNYKCSIGVHLSIHGTSYCCRP